MRRRKGFTLIELLVVIAVIALLMAVIMPALQAAKELATGAVCLSNQRQLCLAWTSYTDDYDHYLVGGSNYYSGSGGTPYRWVEYPLYEDDDNPETDSRPAYTAYTLQYRINGIRAGKLFPYTGNEKLYHCPGDRNYTKYPEPKGVYRSYAVAGLMNGEDFDSRQSGIYTPITDYRSAQVSPLGGQKELYVVTKATEIRSPGDKYVFVEEDVIPKENQYVNEGGFVLLEDGQYNWWDCPAPFHNDSGTVGFSDAHAERHRWQDPDTIDLVKNGDTMSPDLDPDNNEDLAWLVRGYIPR